VGRHSRAPPQESHGGVDLSEEISEEAWEAKPQKVASPTVSMWKPTLEALTNGTPRRITIPAEKTLRGVRIALARQARSDVYKMVLEFREENGELFARRSEMPWTPTVRKPRQKKGSTPVSSTSAPCEG